MSTAPHSLQDLTAAAVHALTAERHAIADALQHVQPCPGFYAIYGDEQAWRDLELEPAPQAPLYVGKAKSSLAKRELGDHFAINVNKIPQTGSSTVRRSFAALLRHALDLHAVPRNLDKPGYYSNYGLAAGGDTRLSAWMQANLAIAVWPIPEGSVALLNSIEDAVIDHFRPPINIAGNRSKSARLSRERAEMTAEAAAWRPGAHTRTLA